MVESSLPKYKINHCADGIQRVCFSFLNWDYEGTIGSKGLKIASLETSVKRDAREAVEFFTEMDYAVNEIWHPTAKDMDDIFEVLEILHLDTKYENQEKIAKGKFDPKPMYVAFYYSGHGGMMKNFVCMIQPTRKDAVKREWDDRLNLYSLEEKISTRLIGKARTLNVQNYFDCCRSNLIP